MPIDQKPLFPIYLLPSVSLPLRRRQSSTPSTDYLYTVPSLSFSPTSSTSTSPSTSPSTPHFIPSPAAQSLKGLLSAALQKDPIYKQNQEHPHTRLSIAQPNLLKCSTCATDIAFATQIVSKGFTGRHGRAFLVAPPPRPPYSQAAEKKNPASKDLVNTKTGRSVNRELLTGQHVVADVTCLICGTVLGWKYVDAKEAAQKYKIGKFILETKRVVVVVSWEEGTGEEPGGDGEDTGELDGLGTTHGVDHAEDDVVVFDSEDEDECEDLFAGIWDPEIVAKRRSRRVNTRKKGYSIL